MGVCHGTAGLPSEGSARHRRRDALSSALAVVHSLATALAAFIAGSARAQGAAVNDDLASWLAQEPERFGRFLEDPKRFRLQVLVGEVRGGAGKGRAHLVRHGFRVDAEYFYPASAVKLCAAAAALEKWGELSDEAGRGLNMMTPVCFGPLSPAYPGDPRSPDGGPLTLDFLLRAALIVSDNDAFNRLYDFVGRDELNQRMWRAGAATARIRHRLDVALSEDENRRTPAVELKSSGAPVRLPEVEGALALEAPRLPGLRVGAARIEGERRVEGPKDFSRKNRISLLDLQNLLAAALRPDLGAGVELRLSPDCRSALARALCGSAGDLRSSTFEGEEFSEARFRPALQGVARVLPRARIEAFGKSGLAYGFQVENAYFADRATGRAFFLAAAIYADADGVVGDGVYDYDSVSRPFLADLGELAARRLLAP